MKPGMEIGQTARISFRVTEDMYAQFEGDIVHPAYSTVSMVYHMEWVSRKIILPFLEDWEEGMGASVYVKHMAPAVLGANITAEATLIKLKKNFVITEVKMFHDDEIIGIGEVSQVILPKEEIHKRLNGAKSKQIQ